MPFIGMGKLGVEQVWMKDSGVRLGFEYVNFEMLNRIQCQTEKWSSGQRSRFRDLYHKDGI